MVRHHCDFSSELLLHDPQSVTKLLRHYPQMGLFQRTKQSAPPPFPQSKVECLLQVSCTATQHWWRGWGRESFIFPFWSGQNVRKALILSPVEVVIGLVLFLARDFSNNHKPRRCKKQNKINKTNKATTKLLLKLIWKLLLININTHKQFT